MTGFRVRMRPLGLAFAATLALVALTAGTIAVARQADRTGAAPANDRVRIGTYDSRAVAIAYARSKPFLQRTSDLHAQHQRATEAGDQKAAGRLAKEGQELQVRMHLQGFSNAPVDEILAQVRDQLPEVAQRRGLIAIVPSTDFRDDARVEVVDVTDDLVSLFDPDAQTQKIITDLKKQPPLPIEQVALMDHKTH